MATEFVKKYWYVIEELEKAEKAFHRRAILAKISKLETLCQKRSPNFYRDRESSVDEIFLLSETTFKSIFRVSKQLFESILEKISVFMPEKDGSAAVSITPREKKKIRGQNVSTRVKLLATLRYLAGGIHWDICLALRIGFGSFFQNNEYGIVWPTINAIVKVEDYSIGIDFKSTPTLERMAAEWADVVPASKDFFNNVLLAVDGLVVRTRKPTDQEVPDSGSRCYRNRKGCWGIVILAGCDALGKFHMWSCRNTGSTNDCTAWERCALKDAIESGQWPENYVIIGDEAFSCKDYFLVPWGGLKIGAPKDAFNYHLSARRQVIERAFGMLIKRWGIFWRPLTCTFDKWTSITTACAKLHNLCIDENVAILPRYYKHRRRGDEEIVIANAVHRGDDDVTIARGQSTEGRRRKLLTDAMSAAGLRRPQHAKHNSKE